MRIYTESEGWTGWDFDPKAVNADITVLKAWVNGNITTPEAAFRLMRNNGWPNRPTSEQFRLIAKELGYWHWSIRQEEEEK